MSAVPSYRGTCVELFAGLGGMALGLSRAGFGHELVVERDPGAVATLRDNLKTSTWPLHDRDVRELDYSDLKTDIDLLAAGVPCQPFSQGGAHAGPADDRNMFPETFAAIRALRPKAILIENVRGLARERFADFLAYILAQLHTPHVAPHEGETWPDHHQRLRQAQAQGGTLGQRYRVEWRSVCVADYGVAQRRVRVIIVAVREDLADRFVWPEPTHTADVLLRDKVDGYYWLEHELPAPDLELPKHTRARVDRLVRPTTTARWRTLRDVTADLDDPPTDGHESMPGHRFWPGAKLYRGHGGSLLDEPSKTIKAGVHGVAGGEHIVHLDRGGHRYLTVRECMRVQDLPDYLTIDAPRSAAMRQVGNAVPPTVAEVFGRAILQAVQPDAARPARAERSRRQDEAAGGRQLRLVQVAGQQAVASVQLRKAYGYLAFRRGVGNPVYLGRLEATTPEERLQEGWRRAHRIRPELFPHLLAA